MFNVFDFMMMLERILFATVFLSLTIHGFFTDEKGKGEIVPSDPNVLVNEILELNCTVYIHTGFNVSMLYWEIPNGQSVSERHLFTLNEQTLQFRRKVTSVREEGLYLCKAIDGNSTEIINSSYVLIEYEAIRNVTNTTCILYDRREEFSCYWDLGEYHHPESLSISASVSMDNNDQNLIPCPLLNIENDPTDRNVRVQCTWTPADGQIHSAIKIVVIDIWNQRFDVPSRRYSRYYETREITKYEPTDFVKVIKQTGCTCVHITWSRPLGVLDISTLLTLKSEWTTTLKVFEVIHTTSHTECHLVPASDYVIHVQVKPWKGQYYSDKKSQSFLTCSIAPAMAVPVFRSGWTSSECYDSVLRDITVYWKKIPRKFQNGQLTKYLLTSGDIYEEINANSSSAELSIPCKENLYFNISACNTEGCSPNSTLTIPYHDDQLAPKTLIVEQINTSAIELTWSGVKDQAGVDIVWCEAKSTTFTCQDEISMMNIKVDGNNVVLQQSAIDRTLSNVIFGVAVLDVKNVSSGIRWQDYCKYWKDLEPKKIMDVTLLSDPPENSLTVSWSPVTCDTKTEKNAYIHSYIVIYCKLDSQNNCKGEESSTRVLASGLPQQTIQKLDPDNNYGIWVQASSLSKDGPKSAMLTGRPTNNDLSSDTLVGITAASLFVFILVLSGVVFIVRNIKRKLGLDEQFPIHIPRMDSRNDSSENLELYHTTGRDNSTFDDCQLNYMTNSRYALKINPNGNIQLMKTKTYSTFDESEIKEQKKDIPPEQKLPPGYTRATPVITNLEDPVESSDIDNTITCNKHLALESGIHPSNQVIQTGEDPTKDKDKPFELKSLSIDEHISQDCGYVSNSASVWDRSDSGDFAVSSLPSCVKFPSDEYCHRDQQEIGSDISECTTFGHIKQQFVTNDISGTAHPSDSVFMSSDYVPCKAFEYYAYDHLGLNKDLKNDFQNNVNNNYLDSKVEEGNSNTGVYVSHSSALNFSGN
uniref:Uncharacterized protein LOC111119467 isoform X2 n=1 Tax=Crassostrea virginica TaxID=6565 RepID=A0A8B8CI25_CRAVI|nr:uncharacterized protein LOC111119467 isoform X2 [Crassostrea virginica]